MLIVLEGIDGGGKTSLAENLVKEAELRGWEGEVWHRGVPTRHPLEEYELDLEDDYPRSAEDRRRRLIVCDRWHLGQLVYGPLYRKDLKDFNLGCAWHVDALLQSLGAVQLILSPPLDVALERSFKRGEDYLQREHFEYVHRAYESMVYDHGHGAEWDVGHGIFHRSWKILREPPDDHDVTTLLDTAMCRSDRANALWPFSTYIGPRSPDLLLLGDRHGEGPRGLRPDAVHHRAAFVPYGGTSGRWLTECIVQSSLSTRRVGIANSNQEDVEALWHTLDRPTVVALGAQAEEALLDTAIPHGLVPHPQYMRRFHHHLKKEYVQAILAASISNGKVSPRW
jgi:thymidylate kinase